MDYTGSDSILLNGLSNVGGRDIMSIALKDTPKELSHPRDLQTVGDFPTRWSLEIVFSHLQGRNLNESKSSLSEVHFMFNFIKYRNKFLVSIFQPQGVLIRRWIFYRFGLDYAAVRNQVLCPENKIYRTGSWYHVTVHFHSFSDGVCIPKNSK